MLLLEFKTGFPTTRPPLSCTADMGFSAKIPLPIDALIKLIRNESFGLEELPINDKVRTSLAFCKNECAPSKIMILEKLTTREIYR